MIFYKIITMLKANYHTHTKRCGHAIGEDEEYVLEAIGKGFRTLGFSDHAMFPTFSEPHVRGDYQQCFDDYISSINALRKKYSQKIDIYLGFEAESIPSFFPFLKELIDNGVLDYLILGNHFSLSDNGAIAVKFSIITNASQLYLYRDLAIKAMRSKMFSIFAHPDYCFSSVSNFDSDCKKITRDIISCAIEEDIPLEINVAGIRSGKKRIGDEDRYIYPTDFFFSVASKMNAKCIIGQDAHSPRQVYADSSVYEAVSFAKRHDLNLVDEIKIERKHSL